MKTIGRILIILTVFSALSGLMVLAVNFSGGSLASDFDGDSQQFRPQGSDDGIRPEGERVRPDHDERGGAGGSRWMFGLIKNVGVMAVLVTLVVLPKGWMRSKRKQAVINSANDGA